MSASSEEQEKRFEKLVKMWSEALNTDKEVNLIGDFNVNLKNNIMMSPLHARLFNLIRKEILPKGVTQLIKEPTRQQGTGKSSLINHIYSSESEKVEVENIAWAGSDHNLIGFRRQNGVFGDRP